MRVVCNTCSGKGFKINQFNQNEETCKICSGFGEVVPCKNFSSNKPTVFRNRKCENCHATEDQHLISVSA